jgi:hypothetical protein
MPTMKAVQKKADERRALAKQFLQQRSAMLRMNLTPVEYLCFRLGCSILVAEKLVEELKEQEAEAGG